MEQKQSKKCEGLTLVQTGKGVQILAGNYLVSTKNFKTYEDAEKYLGGTPLEVIVNVVLLTIKLNKESEAKHEKK